MGAMLKAAPNARLELLNLPDEILLIILRHLDFDSLLDVIYVNRHLRELTGPFLYECITILHGEKALNFHHSLAKDKRRPDWVRSLLISTKFGQERALMKLAPSIALMENLQELTLETPDCNRKKAEDRVYWIPLQDHYEKIFRESSVLVSDPQSRLLPNLKTCVLHFVDTNTELYALSRYASIFLHPTLKSLRIACMSTDSPERLFADVTDLNLYKRSTALEHLHLEECDLYPPALELLLSFPRALRSLTISEGIRYDGIFRAGSSRIHGNLHPQPFSEVLVNTCKDSLESLSLALGYLRPRHHAIDRGGQYLKLRELENLKHLEVNNRTLNLIRTHPECDHRTWKRLPSSLRTFKVFAVPLVRPQHDNRQPDIPLPSCIIQEKELHGVPNLDKIIFSYEHYESTDDDDMNFNDLLMNLVYNETNGNPTLEPANGNPNPAQHINPILNLLQQAVGAVNPPQPAPAPANFITAAMNPNLDAPPQNIQPPRFRWRTGPHRRHARPELNRSDTAKFALLQTIHDTVLDDFTRTNTILEVELVTLPRSFIPPYLFPEDKPKIQERWFTSINPTTPEGFIESIRRQREEIRLQMSRSLQRHNSGSSVESVPANERERSRSRFMRRLREGRYDDELVPDADGGNVDINLDAPDMRIPAMPEIIGENDIDAEMGIEEVLDMFVHEIGMETGAEDDAENSDTSYMYSDTTTESNSGSEGGSVYVDAGTEVEMSEADEDDQDQDEEIEFFIPETYQFRI